MGRLNERLRAPKKLYAADVGLRNLVTGFRDKGAIMENLVFLNIKDTNPCYVYQGGVELDFQFADTLVEVKYGRDLTPKQRALFQAHSAKRKIAVTTIADFLAFRPGG